MEKYQESENWSRGTKKTDYYQRTLMKSKEEKENMPNLTAVVKPEDMPWEECVQGKLKFLINEDMQTVTKTIDAYMQELPPGGKSGKHRHMAEEFIFILEGKGYDLHWDVDFELKDKYYWHIPEKPQKFEWEAGDLVVVPVNTVHQHFNTDPENPARFISATCNVFKLLVGHDLEQLEECDSECEIG